MTSGGGRAKGIHREEAAVQANIKSTAGENSVESKEAELWERGLLGRRGSTTHTEQKRRQKDVRTVEGSAEWFSAGVCGDAG
jgi:hypothetical protein